MLAAGCIDEPRLPDETQVFFSQGGRRAQVTMRDRGGFPDRVVDYEIVVVDASGAQLSVRSDRAQVQSVSHQLSAHQLGSELFIGLGDELCVVHLSRRTALWFAVREVGPHTSLTAARVEALRWRAGDTSADHHERARAALALSWTEPAAALVAFDQLSLGTGNELSMEVEGARARISGDATFLAELRERVPSMRGMEVAGLTRACVPQLAEALAQWRVQRRGPTTFLDDAEAHCR